MPHLPQTIGQPSSQWHVHAWHHCGLPDAHVRFSDRGAALLWLRQFRSEAVAMSALRGVLAGWEREGASLWRFHDDQVLAEIATLLGRGVLHVHRIAPPATQGRTTEVAAPAQVVRSTPVRSASSSAPPPMPTPVDADTFSSRTDGAVTAAVLRAAAESGTPFCEECAKAAASRMAA